MTDPFLQLSLRERRLACLQVEDRMNLQAASVEKDFWVCWTLRKLASIPEIGGHLTFKGGTSLSKAWGLIERFSEDIDLVVDKEVLGFGGEASPDRASSRKKRTLRVASLMAACQEWVQSTLLLSLLEPATAELGPPDSWSVTVDEDTEDGQTLLFKYPGAFSSRELGYVRPVVKIELGARSDTWPSEERHLESYVAQVFPTLKVDGGCNVRTLAAERTFWEKAMLLHEETFRPIDRPIRLQMARHYYDLWCLITRGIADRAVADPALFERVAEHRLNFFRRGWVDYSTLRRGSLRMLPSPERREAWRKDYEAMRGPMFFGQTPEFGHILELVGDFEHRFNSG